MKRKLKSRLWALWCGDTQCGAGWETENAIGKEEESSGSMMFGGVKKRVTATRTLHRLVNRGLIVPEEVNLTLVSEVMAPSAKHHHFFFALLHSFLPHSPPVVKRLYLGQWYSNCRELPSPWNKRKQRKHSSAACLFLHGEKHHLQRGICSYSLCETHFLHGYGVLQQLGENQMSRLCFTKAVRAEIKVFKLSHRPPSDCLSGHPLLISHPKDDICIDYHCHETRSAGIFYCTVA